MQEGLSDLLLPEADGGPSVREARSPLTQREGASLSQETEGCREGPQLAGLPG